jgi:hypothetical protein
MVVVEAPLVGVAASVLVKNDGHSADLEVASRLSP